MPTDYDVKQKSEPIWVLLTQSAMQWLYVFIAECSKCIYTNAGITPRPFVTEYDRYYHDDLAFNSYSSFEKNLKEIISWRKVMNPIKYKEPQAIKTA